MNSDAERAAAGVAVGVLWLTVTEVVPRGKVLPDAGLAEVSTLPSTRSIAEVLLTTAAV